MQKNELVFTKDTIYRLLDIKADAALIIDCTKKTMPFWETEKKISDMDYSDERVDSLSDSIIEINNHFNGVSLNHKQKQIMHERFTMISDILPLVGDRKKRSEKIQEVSEKYGINKQTIRKYLCTYLSYQDIRALAPKSTACKKELSKDEKNYRWALNKYYYNKKKNSLKTVYRLMLKEKYCNHEGLLPQRYPSFYQFRYFYRKTYK